MEERIAQLEQKALKLEPEAAFRNNVYKASTAYANHFYETVSEQKAYQKEEAGAIKDIFNDPIKDEPEQIDSVLEFLDTKVVPQGLNPASGNHYGYIPGGGIFSGAVGDYLAAVTNRYAGVYFASPGAVALETRLVNWMAEMIGYTGNYGGYLASGGSMANLTAIHTAREHAELKAADIPKSVVYLGEQTHHCVARALKICGLKECVMRYIPLDDHYRMKPEALQESIAEDVADGLNPWLIVASAGTTDLGAIDPIGEIAAIAQKHDVWYHVDAAYGGFFMLIEENGKQFKGIEKADSVVLDPHKGLFLSYGTGALIVKNVDHLVKAHDYDANYMQDTKEEQLPYSPADVSPELSKHFRGLRMWLPLKLHGVDAFRSSLEEKMLLTQYAWKKLEEHPEVEVSTMPDLTTFTFRWKPSGLDNYDAINKQLHRTILEEGAIFLSTTSIKGGFWFRFTVLSVRTHKAEIDHFLDVLEKHIKKIS